MIVIAVASVSLRFGLEHLIKFSIKQNESNALSTLKLVSAAIEKYAKDHKSLFPDNINKLVDAEPYYLDKDYTGQSFLRGYNFNCNRLDESGYSCNARPIICRVSGNTVYSVSTGGVIKTENCYKKE
jgi:competence protein ComGC